ncbi:prolipoprotein diacylglyceryl transferase [Candidatus Peregrinibacteria bacterium]|nr:prolipoprotein diacylglyceryl transferase [Candidatus Peregrinibacteria bacterium]
MYPVLISYGPILLSTLWMMIVIGFIAACLIFMKLALYSKLKLYFFRIYFFKILLWGLLFSRIVFILENLDFYFADFGFSTILRIVSFWDKGLSFWGAVAGIVFAFFIYAKREKENIMKWLDILTISISSSMIFGYIGAFFQGINYGTPTDLPWGITLENIEIQYTTPIHPVQLYGAIFMLILTIALAIFLLKNRLYAVRPESSGRTQALETKTSRPGGTPRQGGVALIAAMAYSAFRFLEEFFRGDEITVVLGLRYPQWFALTALIISLIFLLNRYNLFSRSFKFLKKIKRIIHE